MESISTVMIRNRSDQMTAGEVFIVRRCSKETSETCHEREQIMRAHDQRGDRIDCARQTMFIHERRLRFMTFMFWADQVSTANRDAGTFGGVGLTSMRDEVLYSDPVVYYDHSRSGDGMSGLDTIRDEDGNPIIPYYRATRSIDPEDVEEGQRYRLVEIRAMFEWADRFYPYWRDYNPPLGIRRLGYPVNDGVLVDDTHLRPEIDRYAWN